MFRFTRIATVLASLMLCAALWAQTEPSTSVSLPPGLLKVTVKSVKGIVQFRTSADAKWEKATEGTELSEGAELRTGPRSTVQFSIGDDQIVTLDRLGTIQILRASFESGKVFTDLGMKYGRTRYDIESAAREHDAKVRSPSSVLAVRGTHFISQDEAPFPARAVSLEGRVMFRDAHKVVAVGSKGGSRAKVDTESDSPAATALKSTNNLPNGKFAGISNEEALRNLQSAVGGFQNLGVASLIDQARLQNFTVIAVIVKEQLFFGLNWTGLPGSDIALQIISPKGEIVDKAHPVIPGFAIYQDAPPADKTGNGGTKAVTWTSIFPAGKYTINVKLLTPNLPANATVDAIKDPTGQANDFTVLGPNGGPFKFNLTKANPTGTATVDAQPAPTPPPAGALKVRASVSARKPK
jgi:hypothetical protein